MILLPLSHMTDESTVLPRRQIAKRYFTIQSRDLETSLVALLPGEKWDSYAYQQCVDGECHNGINERAYNTYGFSTRLNICWKNASVLASWLMRYQDLTSSSLQTVLIEKLIVNCEVNSHKTLEWYSFIYNVQLYCFDVLLIYTHPPQPMALLSTKF